MLRHKPTFCGPILFSLCLLLCSLPDAIESFGQSEPIPRRPRDPSYPRMHLEMGGTRVPLRPLMIQPSPSRKNRLADIFPRNFLGDKAHPSSPRSKTQLTKPDSVPVGYPVFDLPPRVEINQPFKIDVWIKPLGNNVDGAATIYMEQTNSVTYDPPKFTIKLGERKTIEARILKSRAGLAEITATGDDWGPIEATVDAGFLPILKANLPDVIEGGSERAFDLSFVDSRAKLVPLDAPVKLSLHASNAKMRLASTEPWTEAIDFQIERGASSTPPINIVFESYFRKAGLLTAAIKMNEDYTILNDTFHLEILPRWWVALLMSILGGLLNWFYETTKHWLKAGGRTKHRHKPLASFVVASISGVIGYFLASTNVVGIKLDTTSLRAFVIIGFLFSYVGVDLVLKRGLQWTGENPHEPPRASSPSHPDASS